MSSVTEVLEQEQEDLLETKLCQQAENFVTIRGSHDPRVAFIGEAPGKQEDREGKPFVGRAGTILDDWIAGLGLEADEYAITNVVKCRPPENRTPSKEETERFGQWLDDELDALDPAVVIPLGKTATEFLVPETEDRSFLDEVCYQRFDTRDRTIVPMPHPAYALRSGHEPAYDKVKEVIEG